MYGDVINSQQTPRLRMHLHLHTCRFKITSSERNVDATLDFITGPYWTELQFPLETTICTHSIHKQCAIGMFFLRLLLWQLLLKLLRIRFLNRSHPGTPPFRCRESCPYHEEPRLKASFYPILSVLAALFCTVHQWSRWPRYRLWVFNILKLSCTLEEEELMQQMTLFIECFLEHGELLTCPQILIWP